MRLSKEARKRRSGGSQSRGKKQCHTHSAQLYYGMTFLQLFYDFRQNVGKRF